MFSGSKASVPPTGRSSLWKSEHLNDLELFCLFSIAQKPSRTECVYLKMSEILFSEKVVSIFATVPLNSTDAFNKRESIL